MDKLFLFGILSVPMLIISWRSFFKITNHGFYRFFSWECIIWLFVANYKFWFDEPFSLIQLLSWFFLFISLFLLIAGLIKLRNGNPSGNRDGASLFYFERTTSLVQDGIYKYIRHPMYSSLIFLSLGVFFKNPTVPLAFVTVFSMVLLYLTAITDEKECILYFGKAYEDYMKRTKRFIPFLF